MTLERQRAMTPDVALRRLREGNDRFVAGRTADRNLYEFVKVTGRGQFPFAAVIACADAMAAPERVFDQSVGDLFVARVAGNTADSDTIASLEYATRVGGARLVVVLGHSHCGAVESACSGRSLGHMNGLAERIRAAADSVPDEDGMQRSTRDPAFMELVARANVRHSVRSVLRGSPLLREMVRNREIAIVGALLDDSTGRADFDP